MINFAIKSFEESEFNTRTPVKCLVREGKLLIDEFISEIKKNKNLEPELSRLYAIIEDAANGNMLPINKFRQLKGFSSFKFKAFEAKSTNLRMYLFIDNGMIIIIGGKKTTQPEDTERVKRILKDYINSK